MARPRPPLAAGKPAVYVLTASAVQEINWHKQEFSSWFVGNSVVGDGSLYLSTPVDPLLLLLPLLERAKGDAAPGAGRFCDLEQVLCMADAPAAQLLAPLLATQLACVCDVTEAGGQSYYRLSQGKALAWLRLKVAQAARALQAAPGAAFANLDDAAITAYAAGLLGESLSPAWAERLAAALGLQAAAPAAAHRPPPMLDFDAPVEKRQRVSGIHSGAAAGRSAGGSFTQPGPPLLLLTSSTQSYTKPDGCPLLFPVQIDPKEAAKAKAAESRLATKEAARAKEASKMRKLSSFFTKKPAAA